MEDEDELYDSTVILTSRPSSPALMDIPEEAEEAEAAEAAKSTQDSGTGRSRQMVLATSWASFDLIINEGTHCVG